MKLRFLGANGQVTGSRYCLEAGGKRLMIDCGLVQERQYLGRNWEPSPVDPRQLDALLLTHVHIDHAGLIPKLVAEGFAGPIYCTPPTADLAPIVLEDSARIQMEDAEYKRKRHRQEGRQGRYPVVPLYTDRDVDRTLPHLRSVPYAEPLVLDETFTVTFHDAGHILGSAMLDITVRENGSARRVLFSGDIGQWDKPLLRDPTLFEQADYVVMESTYGDRDHPAAGDVAGQLAAVINRTAARGGAVMIPVFAVERAQEMMYHISRLVHEDQIPDLPFFLDSPMAVDVTAMFLKHRLCLDEETWELIARQQSPLGFSGLKMVRDAEQSKAINGVRMPCVIMATSGMCTAGRIKHHLKQRISDPANTVLFVGYQGRGTLGRQILEGAEQVRILGRMHRVLAQVEQISGFSGHADRTALLRWLGNLRQPPRQVFLTHGEQEVSLNLAQRIAQQLQWPVRVPAYGEAAELD